MAHNREYTRIWDPAGPANGLGVHEIATVLGGLVEDIGICCTSAAINKFAKWKPFRNSAWGFASAAAYLNARRSCDWGFSDGLNPFIQSFSAAFLKACRDNAEWDYYAPRRNSTDRFRPLDFSAVNGDGEQEGYDSQAVAPVELESMPDRPTVVTGGADYHCNAIASATGLRLDDFQQILDERTAGREWYYALVYRKVTSTTPSIKCIVGDPAFENDDLETADYHDVTLRFRTNTSQGDEHDYGSYEVVFGLLSLDPDDLYDTGESLFLPIPGAHKIINWSWAQSGVLLGPDNHAISEDADLPYRFTFDARYDSYLQKAEFAFRAVNYESHSETLTIHIRASYTDQGAAIAPVEVSRTVTIPSEGSVEGIVITLSDFGRDYWDKDYVVFECWFSYNESGSSYRYYSLANDTTSASQLQPVSIEDIEEAHGGDI